MNRKNLTGFHPSQTNGHYRGSTPLDFLSQGLYSDHSLMLALGCASSNRPRYPHYFP